MRSFDDLVAEGAAADVTGWDFGWLDGRATEQRPPWGYARLLAQRLPQARAALDLDTGGGEIVAEALAASSTHPARLCATEAWPPNAERARERLGTVDSALDIDTGGGEVVAEAPRFPPRMVVTESWPPNAQRARELLGPRGVEVVDTTDDAPWPVGSGSVELVSSRHPVRPRWDEIERVLRPGGRYLAQHVGPESAFELIEQFRPVTAAQRTDRDPAREVAEAERAGLTVTDVRTARCRMEFYDVGAIVYILRKCVWWVHGFDVDADRPTLRALHERIREDGMVVAHSTRHLIEATR